MAITIPELDEIRGQETVDPQRLYDALKRVQNYLNRLPFIFGDGDPNGQIPAKPGTFFIPRDPLMASAAYIKASGTDEFGWTPLVNGLTGYTVVDTTYSGSTTNAAFTVVKEINFIPPANTRQWAFPVTVTGDGAVRLRIKDTNIYSNELTASGTLTLSSIPNTARIIQIECRANAGTLTADVVVKENRLIAGNTVMGSREDATASGGTQQPPIEPPSELEHPSFGNPDAYQIY